MLERFPSRNIDYALFRKIGLVCASDEAILDMRRGSAVAVGYNQTYQATVRSHFDSDEDGEKIWHTISLVDKNEPSISHFCKVSKDGQAFYSDSQKSPIPREMFMQDSNDFWTVFCMIGELDDVKWLPQAPIEEAESEMPRFNL